MKLIEESLYNNGYDYDVVEEGVGDNKTYKIVGPYQTFNAKNINGNIYPLENVKAGWDTFIEQNVKTGRGIGELDHPHKIDITLNKIVHKINQLEYIGNELVGTSRILNPNKSDTGRVACTLIDEKIPFGVSIRALGTFNEKREMQNNFKVLAVDLVFNPSNHSSMVDPILESIEYDIDEQGNVFLSNSIKNLKTEVSKKKKKDEDIAAAIKNLFYHL